MTRIPSDACVFWDVDTQVDFIHPNGKLHVAGAETIVGNLAALTDFAHANGIRIVGSSDSHAPTDDELSETPDFADTYPPHCLAGTPGQQRIPETALRDVLVVEPDDATADVLERLPGHAGDILFHKRYFDVFTNPNVGPVVQALAVDEVVLYGVALDVCNRYAVEGLLERYPGLPITLVTDAVRAINEDRRGELLADWQRRGVRLARTVEIIAKPR
ncbi:MAG: cysteine hydrolase family protein [Gammaproteobacteria bacterium]|nr:cysteine hydrolase family protein [Gammaproteobacteria bacterium]